MSLELVKFLWESRVYGIDQMRDLVADRKITAEEFFEITRRRYS